jgi:glucose-1-phosphate thymidylyltransferase
VRSIPIDDDLLIVGGDNLFRFDLRDLVRFAGRRGTSIAAYRLPSRELASRYGNIELDDQERICWFEEKPATPRTALIATCIYVLRRQDQPMLERYRQTGALMDAPGLFIRWLAQQTDVYGFVCDGLWFDIGDPQSLEAARAAA